MTTCYRTADLIGLSRLYASNIDASAFTAATAARGTELQALQRERAALEAATRRRFDVEQHVSLARQTAYERRLQELQAKPAEEEAAAARLPPTQPPAGKATLEEARQRFASFVSEAAPTWEQKRRAAQAETIAKLREELQAVQEQRANAQSEFAADLQQRVRPRTCCG